MMIGWSFASRKPARRGQGGSARVGVAGWGDGGVRCGCGLGARGGGALTAVGLCLVVGRCRLHRAGAWGGRRRLHRAGGGRETGNSKSKSQSEADRGQAGRATVTQRH